MSKLLKITSFFEGVLKIPLLKQVLVFPISVPVLKLLNKSIGNFAIRGPVVFSIKLQPVKSFPNY